MSSIIQFNARDRENVLGIIKPDLGALVNF